MLSQLGDVAKLYADPTRLRLLLLLEQEALSVAELAQILALAQPRVSTHLAKLREAGVVVDRRVGVQAYYRLADQQPPAAAALWASMREHAQDPVIESDQARLQQLLSQRNSGEADSWADRVAGDMERHYSPGRSWASLVHAISPLLSLGKVLDIAGGDGLTAALLAPQSRRYTLVDRSHRVADAARERLGALNNVEIVVADMHSLPQAQGQFDHVLMLQALPYSDDPGLALREAARVLKVGGSLVLTALEAHQDASVRELYGHRNLGVSLADLGAMVGAAGLQVSVLQRIARERRPPHFQPLLLSAHK